MAGVLLLICAGNFLLAIFNLFPGYPLDGGRVLRAILWRRTGDIREATRMAGICGMLIAAILIIFGVYMVVAPTFRSYFMGFWSVLVGLFLFDAAYSVVKHVQVRLQNIVREAMIAPFSIEPDLLISQPDRFYSANASPGGFSRRARSSTARDVIPRRLEIAAARTLALTRARDVMRPIAPRFFVEPNGDARLRSRTDETQRNRFACCCRQKR